MFLVFVDRLSQSWDYKYAWLHLVNETLGTLNSGFMLSKYNPPYYIPRPSALYLLQSIK